MEFPSWIDWTAGVGYRVYESDGATDFRRSAITPHVGAEISVTDDLIVRMAYTRALNPRLVSEQRLEPTTVAGFSQFVENVNTAVIDQVGIGVDYEINPALRVGAAAKRRWFDIQTDRNSFANTKDLFVDAYFSALIGDRWAARLSFEHEQAESTFQFDLPEFAVSSVRADLRYFHPSGFFGTVGVEHVWHEFRSLPNLDPVQVTAANENFVYMDAAAGWRLPNNRGAVSVQALNLLDQDFGFKDRSLRRDLLVTPRYMPDLTILFNVQLKL